MRELTISNHALGNPDELARIWSEQGYWFFKDVLDPEAVGALRGEYMAELKAMAFVDADASEPMWNGKPIDDFPETLDSLHKRKVWQGFVAKPSINAFFEKVLDDEISWIPIDYYRIVPPRGEAAAANAYLAIHQDGMSNPGVDFVTCWMPLTEIDDRVGGLVLATGHHDRGYMDVIDGKAAFRDGPAISDDAWSSGYYTPGDVVIFTPSMPHYGLGNTSNRFRLSLDIRAARKSGRLPVVGTVITVNENEVRIATAKDGEVRLAIDNRTFLRGPGKPNPVPITRAQLTSQLPPGTEVMATRDGDRALVLRPHF